MLGSSLIGFVPLSSVGISKSSTARIRVTLTLRSLIGKKSILVWVPPFLFYFGSCQKAQGEQARHP